MHAESRQLMPAHARSPPHPDHLADMLGQWPDLPAASRRQVHAALQRHRRGSSAEYYRRPESPDLILFLRLWV